MYDFEKIFENRYTTETVAHKEFFAADGTRVIAEMWVVRGADGEVVNGGCSVFCNGIPAKGIQNFQQALEVARDTVERISRGEALPDLFNLD